MVGIFDDRKSELVKSAVNVISVTAIGALIYLEFIFCRAFCVDSVIFVTTFLIFVGYATIWRLEFLLLHDGLAEWKNWNELIRMIERSTKLARRRY